MQCMKRAMQCMKSALVSEDVGEEVTGVGFGCGAGAGEGHLAAGIGGVVATGEVTENAAEMAPEDQAAGQQDALDAESVVFVVGDRASA
jgi:hypothetical protein